MINPASVKSDDPAYNALMTMNLTGQPSVPVFYRYYDERALLYLRMGDTQAAVADFQEALKLYPRDEVALENLRALGVPGY